VWSLRATAEIARVESSEFGDKLRYWRITPPWLRRGAADYLLIFTVSGLKGAALRKADYFLL
jgi:hypothetical protein